MRRRLFATAILVLALPHGHARSQEGDQHAKVEKTDGRLESTDADASAALDDESNVDIRSTLLEAIGKLGSKKFRERQDAHRALIDAGVDAVELLEEAARSDQMEVAARSVDALALIAISDEGAEAGIAALERLASETTNQVAGHAAATVAALNLTDEDCAVSASKAAGVRIGRDGDGNVCRVRVSRDQELALLRHLPSLGLVGACVLSEPVS